METNRRNYDIDLLRFLAALSVILFHYTFRGYSADNMSCVTFYEMSSVTKYGYLGVNLFFMISGYVILMSAYSRRASEFLISRIVRLYPAFWTAVLLTSLTSFIFAQEVFSVNSLQIIANLTMVPSLFKQEYVDGVYWTLLIELKFYLLIFLLLLFGMMNQIKIFAFTWIVWSVFYYYFNFPYRLHDVLFPSFAAYFVAGAMFFLIRKEGLSLFKLIIIALSYLAAVLYGLEHLQSQMEHFEVAFSASVVMAVLTSFYGLFFLISMEKNIFFDSKALYHLGILTYPVYLIHQNIGYMIFNYFGDDVNKYILLGSVVFLMLILSYLIHLFIEKKVSSLMQEKLKTYF